MLNIKSENEIISEMMNNLNRNPNQSKIEEALECLAEAATHLDIADNVKYSDMISEILTSFAKVKV